MYVRTYSHDKYYYFLLQQVDILYITKPGTTNDFTVL